MAFLKKKDIDSAIETFKSFEKKDKILMARAASNISFLYFLEGDYKSSEKYADVAINYDRYNAKALVNRGNCLFMMNEFLRAKVINILMFKGTILRGHWSGSRLCRSSI